MLNKRLSISFELVDNTNTDLKKTTKPTNQMTKPFRTSSSHYKRNDNHFGLILQLIIILVSTYSTTITTSEQTITNK